MSVATQPATTLAFEKFWHFLTEHPNCIIRAGTADSVLFDMPEMHWDFFDEDEGRAVVQLIRGKSLVGELVIDRTIVKAVHGSIDVEEAAQGYWLFEVMAASAKDDLPAYHFLMSHGVDHDKGHQMLKH